MKITPSVATNLIKQALVKYPYLVKHTGLQPVLVHDLLLSQMRQESALNDTAQSHVGAYGLMQLMPATAAELLTKTGLGIDWKSPPSNTILGIYYMQEIYKRFGEIPDNLERYKMSLASYNGGRGYVNAMLALAREQESLPKSYAGWKKGGKPAGQWQVWDYASPQLQNVKFKGKTPDWNQMLDYVAKIIGKVPADLLKLRN